MSAGDCKNCDFWSGPLLEEWNEQHKTLKDTELDLWELNFMGRCRRFPETVEKRGFESCGEYRGKTYRIWSVHSNVSAASHESMHNWETVSWSETAQAEDQRRRIAAEKKIKDVRRELREVKAKIKADEHKLRGLRAKMEADAHNDRCKAKMRAAV